MLPSMTPPRTARRLSADDWIEAGFAVLVDSGPNALRIDALCERLNVTKGSFYWHFTDMPAYRSALVEAWGTLGDRNRRPFENMPGVDPRERLDVMMRTLVAPQHWALERAMRVWALTDDEVRASVQRSDRRGVRPPPQPPADHGARARGRSTAVACGVRVGRRADIRIGLDTGHAPRTARPLHGLHAAAVAGHARF
jgi:AcrR family transcriptional regulator